MMTAPMVDYKIHWLKMMSVPESRAVVGRHDGINGRDRQDQVYAQLQRPPPRQRYGEPATAAQVPDRAKILGQAFDKAIYGLRDILPAYEILGWHCTRLTDAETDDILRGWRLSYGVANAVKRTFRLRD